MGACLFFISSIHLDFCRAFFLPIAYGGSLGAVSTGIWRFPMLAEYEFIPARLLIYHIAGGVGWIKIGFWLGFFLFLGTYGIVIAAF